MDVAAAASPAPDAVEEAAEATAGPAPMETDAGAAAAAATAAEKPEGPKVEKKKKAKKHDVKYTTTVVRGACGAGPIEAWCVVHHHPFLTLLHPAYSPSAPPPPPHSPPPELWPEPQACGGAI